MDAPQEEKVCSVCNKSKALDAFPPSKRNADGRSAWCRNCHNLYRREKRAEAKARKETPTPTETQVEQEVPPQRNAALVETPPRVVDPDEEEDNLPPLPLVPAENAAFAPLPWQTKFLASKARFRVVCAGRRSGKTYACLQEVIKFCAETKNANVWWVAPTFGHSKIAFNVFNKLYPANSERRQRIISSVHTSPPPQRIEFRSGSTLEFRSADKPDSLVGVGLHLLVLDEAALLKEDVWTVALRPTLQDYRGRAIFISTPRGKNWFYYLWLRGQPENNVDFSDWESFHASTFENLSIPDVRKEVEDAKREYGEHSDKFKQEYLADFLDDSSSVFRDLDENLLGDFHRLSKEGDAWILHEKDSNGKEFPNAVSPNGIYTIGLDYAVSRDWTVITVTRYVKAHNGWEKRVVYLERFQAAAPIVAERVARVHRRYNKARVIVDATGKGDALVLELQKHIPTYLIVPFILSKVSKPQLIQRLQNDLAMKRVTFPNIPVLLNELNSYRAEYNSETQHVSYSAPNHAHDDCVISLALATEPQTVSVTRVIPKGFKHTLGL